MSYGHGYHGSCGCGRHYAIHHDHQWTRCGCGKTHYAPTHHRHKHHDHGYHHGHHGHDAPIPCVMFEGPPTSHVGPQPGMSFAWFDTKAKELWLWDKNACQWKLAIGKLQVDKHEGEDYILMGDCPVVALADLQGPPGAAGAQGEPGVAGATGPVGPKGDTGATGPKGDQGDQGPTGPAGSDGGSGSAGTTVSGIAFSPSNPGAGQVTTLTLSTSSGDLTTQLTLPPAGTGGGTGTTDNAGTIALLGNYAATITSEGGTPKSFLCAPGGQPADGQIVQYDAGGNPQYVDPPSGGTGTPTKPGDATAAQIAAITAATKMRICNADGSEVLVSLKDALEAVLCNLTQADESVDVGKSIVCLVSPSQSGTGLFLGGNFGAGTGGGG